MEAINNPYHRVDTPIPPRKNANPSPGTAQLQMRNQSRPLSVNETSLANGVKHLKFSEKRLSVIGRAKVAAQQHKIHKELDLF